MRYGFIACLLILGGCGGLEAYDSARSMSETFYLLKKHNGLVNEETVGTNPYDLDPDYRMAYCQIGKMQHWSTVTACLNSNGKPQI